MPLYLELSLIAALFIFMLDYGLGHPADAPEKIGYGSFLFSYSLFLSTLRLVKAGLYSDMHEQYISQKPTDALHSHQIKRQFEQLVFTQGRQLFTWEKAFGMCPYCTHFWFTLFLFIMVNIFYLQANIITFIFYFLLSHLFIRLLKKI